MERVNRFASVCDSCGTEVAAGAGTWQEGVVFCGSARRIKNDQGNECGWLICPKKFDAKQEQFFIDDQIRNERYQKQIADIAANIIVSDESICPKCGGSGLYVWANGDHDVCYGCDGSGNADKFGAAS